MMNSFSPRVHRSHYSQANGERSNKQMKMTLSQPARTNTQTHTHTHNLEKDYTRDKYKIKTFHLIISGKINRSPQTHSNLRARTIVIQQHPPWEIEQTNTHMQITAALVTGEIMDTHMHSQTHLNNETHTPRGPSSVALCTISLASLKPNLIHYQFTTTEVVWTAGEIQFHSVSGLS